MDKFNAAFKNGANIGYIVAGYPSLDYTREFMNSLDSSAIDILEIGIPYSDPLADGKTIAEASFQACNNGVTTDAVFDTLAKCKTKKCLVFLVYYNLIYAYGEDRFLRRAKEIGIDGLIVPDLPYEESFEFNVKCASLAIALIPLISVTSSIERIAKIVRNARGFIYVIGALGVTGSKQSPLERLKNLCKKIREFTSVPLAVGFGLRTNEDVKSTKQYANGAIIGTQIVKSSGECKVSELNERISALFKD